MVPIALKNINMNTKEKNSTLTFRVIKGDKPVANASSDVCIHLDMKASLLNVASHPPAIQNSVPLLLDADHATCMDVQHTSFSSQNDEMFVVLDFDQTHFKSKEVRKFFFRRV